MLLAWDMATFLCGMTPTSQPPNGLTAFCAVRRRRLAATGLDRAQVFALPREQRDAQESDGAGSQDSVTDRGRHQGFKREDS